MECLPYEGKTYKIATDEMRQYCKELNDKLYNDDDFDWYTLVTPLVNSIFQREYTRAVNAYNETYNTMNLWSKELPV